MHEISMPEAEAKKDCEFETSVGDTASFRQLELPCKTQFFKNWYFV